MFYLCHMISNSNTAGIFKDVSNENCHSAMLTTKQQYQSKTVERIKRTNSAWQANVLRVGVVYAFSFLGQLREQRGNVS